MTLDAQALAPLFEISRDAVMGIDNEIILFANPVARSLLGAEPGKPLSAYLSKNIRDILLDPAQLVVTATYFKGHSGTLSVRRLEGLTLLTFVPQKAPVAVSHQPLLRKMADSLFTLRLAADGVMKGAAPAGQDQKLDTYANILYQSYYQLKRLYQHISLLDLLDTQSLPQPERLLDISHICDALYRTVEPLIRNSGVTMHYHVQPGTYRTLADENHIEVLILNLLANSLAHTRTGNTVELGLAHLAGKIVLSVNDTGCGIDPDVLSDLFNGTASVKTTDTQAGAGLGLALVRSIAEHYGGTVMLESKPERGTTIRVTLPERLPKQTVVHAPPISYRDDGMNTVLTELSDVLGKEFYTRKMFD